MNPQAAFVIALARGDPDPAPERADVPLDVDRTLRLAHRHQVDALCSWMGRKRSRREGTLSDSLLRPLRRAYLHHLVRNEYLLGNLADLESSLSDRNVEALYLKGPWLAFRAYPDPGTRPIGDVDLCIREADYPKALAALEDLGFAARGTLPESPEEALRRAHYGRQLRFTARGRRPVELHFRLVNFGSPSESESWVWETARELAVDSLTIRVPGPEAMLLQLLLHANQHAFAILRLMHDIRWALERDASNCRWDLLDSKVRALRCRASAYHALALAGELAGARPPSSLLENWRPSPARRAIFSRTWNLEAARRLETSRRRMETESPLFYLLEMGRLRDKLKFLAGVVREAGGLGPFVAGARQAFTRTQSATGGSGR